MKQAATHAAKQSIACALAISTAFCITTPATHAQCQYEITTIIEGPGCWPSNVPAVLAGTGMNSQGHVTGYHFDCHISGYHHGFFWTPQTGRITMHKPPDVWRVWPRDINDNGLIVGFMDITGVGQRGFVYDMHTQQYLALLEPLHGVGNSTLNAINNAGIAVGSRSIGKPGQSPNPTNAVIWNTNTGEVIDLGVGDGPNSTAEDGTDSKDTGGWSGTAYFTANARALLWIGDEVVQLDVLPGMSQNAVWAVNNHLDVVGTSGDGTIGGIRRFVWLEGIMTEFLPPEGYDRASPSDINDSRQIVGSMRVKGTSTFHPHLWQHGDSHDLRTLIVNAPPNLTIGGAIEVGNDGRIRTGGSLGSNVAVVLTPIGQPSGDFNYDCNVDVHDLLILLDAWGPIPRAKRQIGQPADLNGDGVVDVSDLLMLLANWSN